MEERPEQAWRDDRALPLSDLTRAMATYSHDGQVDDVTGGEAGAEEEFGHGPRPIETAADQAAAEDEPHPDRASGSDRLRPSPDGSSPSGRSGPT
ncbi:hypothetical protein EV385_5868 [Krasilnikovia cinnamomea]|uniref:Uncharacterized protein n=1 Tax=Krasilnikovia cinnamomea TaxID=349313 RepID=A0A4Q7ZRZ9_9ACTN|nr:hypothetical protein [Krasilnikovia cinnamomea]RZU53932.1 hypothetical protein EV385_5868 [Krasilnikovia cinnamomea]